MQSPPSSSSHHKKWLLVRRQAQNECCLPALYPGQLPATVTTRSGKYSAKQQAEQCSRDHHCIPWDKQINKMDALYFTWRKAWSTALAISATQEQPSHGLGTRALQAPLLPFLLTSTKKPGTHTARTMCCFCSAHQVFLTCAGKAGPMPSGCCCSPCCNFKVLIWRAYPGWLVFFAVTDL